MPIFLYSSPDFSLEVDASWGNRGILGDPEGTPKKRDPQGYARFGGAPDLGVPGAKTRLRGVLDRFHTIGFCIDGCGTTGGSEMPAAGVHGKAQTVERKIARQLLRFWLTFSSPSDFTHLVATHQPSVLRSVLHTPISMHRGCRMRQLANPHDARDCVGGGSSLSEDAWHARDTHLGFCIDVCGTSGGWEMPAAGLHGKAQGVESPALLADYALQNDSGCSHRQSQLG
jgi:hypothetical protein